jgi:hypothetical protein
VALMMREAQHRSASAFVNIAGNACAAVVSLIRIFHSQHAIGVVATRRGGPKTRGADSESGFLAIKKFSWVSRKRLIAARQNRIFGRIVATDSQRRFAVATIDGSL